MLDLIDTHQSHRHTVFDELVPNGAGFKAVLQESAGELFSGLGDKDIDTGNRPHPPMKQGGHTTDDGTFDVGVAHQPGDFAGDSKNGIPGVHYPQAPVTCRLSDHRLDTGSRELMSHMDNTQSLMAPSLTILVNSLYLV